VRLRLAYSLIIGGVRLLDLQVIGGTAISSVGGHDRLIGDHVGVEGDDVRDLGLE
jgi:hypothetical protein